MRPRNTSQAPPLPSQNARESCWAWSKSSRNGLPESRREAPLHGVFRASASAWDFQGTAPLCLPATIRCLVNTQGHEYVPSSSQKMNKSKLLPSGISEVGRSKKNPRSHSSEICASDICTDVMGTQRRRSEKRVAMEWEMLLMVYAGGLWVCFWQSEKIHSTWMARTSSEAPGSLLSLLFCTWCFGHGQTAVLLFLHSLLKSSSVLPLSWTYLPQKYHLHKECKLKSYTVAGVKKTHHTDTSISLFHKSTSIKLFDIQKMFHLFFNNKESRVKLIWNPLTLTPFLTSQDPQARFQDYFPQLQSKQHPHPPIPSLVGWTLGSHLIYPEQRKWVALTLPRTLWGLSNMIRAKKQYELYGNGRMSCMIK